MVKVTDILDWEKLNGHVLAKDVTMRRHPEFSNLAIFNYADSVQIQGLWDHETRTARGLIVDLGTLEVLARPFKKFFNYGQESVDYDLDAPLYHVGNKYDGSLGIVYRRPDGRLAVATRGSFESEQAIHATAILEGRDNRDLEYYVDQGFTPLCEIVYPENRIVVDYGNADMLVDLGMTDNETGAYTPSLSDPAIFGKYTLRDVLSRPDRPNSEGWVIWTDPYTAVKIKQQDYIELHRIVTGLNRKSVWRALSKGEDEFSALLEQLPDELYEWAKGVAAELRNEYAAIMRAVDNDYIMTVEAYADAGGGYMEEFDRKLFAQTVAGHAQKEHAGFMFAILDRQHGKVQDKIWRMVEPSGSER